MRHGLWSNIQKKRTEVRRGLAQVRVEPYVPDEGEDLSAAAEELLSSATAEAVSQIGAGLAASLNRGEPTGEELAAAEEERLAEQAAQLALAAERAAAEEAARLALVAEMATMDTAAAEAAQVAFDVEQARLAAEQADADRTAAEAQRLAKARAAAEALEAATRTRDVLMDALLAPPPPPPLCTAAADGGDCLNKGTVTGTEGGCSCRCVKGFAGSNCQDTVGVYV
jgi:hypothetical protein